MSLLLILRKIWKYKLVTLPLMALVLAGACYLVVATAPTYEASSTYILEYPPPPPTDAQIAANPALASVKADNPYTRFADQNVLVQVLTSRLNSEEGRKSLVAQGADRNYTAAPSPELGFSAPILQITGTGTTPEGAINTTNLVGRAAAHELDKMQANRGVDETYRIKAEPVVVAHDATLKASGKLRALVGVLALGTILLFIVISVLDALSALRTEWAERRAGEDRLAVVEPFLPPATLHRNGGSQSDSDEEGSPWPREAHR
jgi:hypothetical protein